MFNNIYYCIYTLSLYKCFLKFLLFLVSIHCSLIKKLLFGLLKKRRNITLDIKEGEMGVSDFNFILTSSVATCVWMLPFNHKLAPLWHHVSSYWKTKYERKGTKISIFKLLSELGKIWKCSLANVSGYLSYTSVW